MAFWSLSSVFLPELALAAAADADEDISFVLGDFTRRRLVRPPDSCEPDVSIDVLSSEMTRGWSAICCSRTMSRISEWKTLATESKSSAAEVSWNVVSYSLAKPSPDFLLTVLQRNRRYWIRSTNERCCCCKAYAYGSRLNEPRVIWMQWGEIGFGRKSYTVQNCTIRFRRQRQGRNTACPTSAGQHSYICKGTCAHTHIW